MNSHLQPDPKPPGKSFLEAFLLQSFWRTVWIVLAMATVILLVGLGLSAPGKRPPKNQVEAISGFRQIGLALFEFQNEFGRFPGASTAVLVEKNPGTGAPSSDRTSNDLLAQLIQGGILASEMPFHLRSRGMLRKVDNVFNTASTILAHGECAYAYIPGQDERMKTVRPLVFGPVVPGSSNLDREWLDGKAIVLMSDLSISMLPINPAGKIMDGGMDILDPRQPYWAGKAPDVKWPK